MCFSPPFSGDEEPAAGLDAQAVGRSIFGNFQESPPPDIQGYSPLQFIGKGGLGHVWLARSGRDGEEVALKIPHETDVEPAERLIAEARILERLRHPGIVRLIELTEDREGTPVLVMELVRGMDLSRAVPPGGLDFEEAVNLFFPVLEAVDYLHRQGIVHRDIKPANILIGADGATRITDFGLARTLDSSNDGSSLTEIGLIAGTLEYVAPERFEPEAQVAVATDIYALGIMLYEMLTGQLPRGSWEPLSKIRKLDVRLDALIAEATHPSPHKRLKNAAVFSRRLREIQKTRPHYGGAPLRTLPVRMGDAVWTLTGLYAAVAGLCSLGSLNGAQVPRIFDLTLNHTRLLGGFWSAWILSLLQGGLWLWQGWRLWLFRKVRLRESLPSPFGLDPGTSRGAAGVVAVAQIACVWCGFFCLVGIVFQSNHWITDQTPFWERGLCVTERMNGLPVSPWSWRPSFFFNTDAYVIREVQPGLKPGTWQWHDSRGFLIFIQPLLMAVGMAGIVMGILMTAVTTAVEWHWHRRRVQAVPLLLLAGVAAYVWGESARQKARRRSNEGNSDLGALYIRREAQRRNSPDWLALVRNVFGQAGSGMELPGMVDRLFDARIEHEQLGSVPRGHLLNWLLRERRSSQELHRAIEDWQFSLNPAGDPFPVCCCFESYTDEPGGWVTGSHVTLLWRGRITADPPGFVFNHWDSKSEPLYKTRPRMLDQRELAGWLEGFLFELGRSGCPGLEEYLLESMLMQEPDDSRHFQVEPGASLAEAFRLSREGWDSLAFYLTQAPGIRMLSGGRWEITALINRVAVRPDGETEQPAVPMNWRMEIIPVKKGDWRILRLDM